MHSKTTTYKVLSVVLANLVVLEVASFAAVHALGIVSPNRRLDLFVDSRLEGLTDATLAAYFEAGYDAELGWDNVPGRQVTQRNVLGEPWTASYDASGARVSCQPSDGTTEQAAFIATFGDSLTRGDEVGDSETWQCEIERRIGRRVANYGVGGYDVAQALHKAQRQWAEGRVAPITILGVYTDDLARVLNRYRPYIDQSSAGNLGFKPSFRYLDGRVVFLPNPLRREITAAEVRDLALAVAPTDYWAQEWGRVLPDFPYSLQLLRTGSYVVGSRLGTPPWLVNVWATEEGREVMLHLLREFVASAQRHGTRPVLLLIPDVSDWRDGRAAPDYREFVQHSLNDAHLDLTVIDVAEAEFDASRFSIKPFEGHASLYGNTVIAEAVLRELSAALGTTHDHGASTP